MAAWLLTFSCQPLEGSGPMSEIPGNKRTGGAERVPFLTAPNLAAEMMCLASSTVPTCGTMIEAPASRAQPMAAWSWPGTLGIVRGVGRLLVRESLPDEGVTSAF